MLTSNGEGLHISDNGNKYQEVLLWFDKLILFVIYKAPYPKGNRFNVFMGESFRKHERENVMCTVISFINKDAKLITDAVIH